MNNELTIAVKAHKVINGSVAINEYTLNTWEHGVWRKIEGSPYFRTLDDAKEFYGYYALDAPLRAIVSVMSQDTEALE